MTQSDQSSNIAKPTTDAVLGLTIRATRADDYEALCALTNLPGFRAGTLRLPYQRPEQTKKWLESQGQDSFNVVALIDNTIVGQAGLHPNSGRRAHAATVGIGVHDDHVGKGVGTALMSELLDAADNWLGFKRLELTVFTDNAPAIRLYEKFGFEREGIRRSFAFKAGTYVDALGMGRLSF
ncbi:GNAT family N-acetyltransferase [Sinorhizobium meliloti]|uniref:GNAT family N-acetyltransferase n=1 Tax=Rhizobium meliloti TaxID=382 RepID=UPI000EFA4A7D|nr:GNAT family N-acetyltransferase [Sinorhizobium meliloti]RMC62504.1 GNAT family N-acetyltransferase [Sinorhizobium meliloti]